MLQMYDVRTMTPQKVMEQPLIIRNQSGSLHLANSMEQVNSLSDAGQNSMLTSVANEHLPSQLLLPAAEPDLSSMRPKKRKSSTSELLPWHKELSQGSERVQDIRWLTKLCDFIPHTHFRLIYTKHLFSPMFSDDFDYRILTQ